MLGGLVLAVPASLLLHGVFARLILLYFWNQDAVCLFLAGLALMLSTRLPDMAFSAIPLRWANGRPARSAALLSCAAAGCAALVGLAVFHGFDLSRDELMADFDAAIFRTGRVVAPIAPAWRPFANALIPAFTLPIPANVGWVSGYLPGNAAFRALVGLAIDPRFCGPLLVASACGALYGSARRLWHDRPGTALVCLVLFAASPQILLTGATSYAMNIHLAVNLLWLWLFLRDDRPGHAGAMGAGFIGCGLHQVVFHPLFAAPFIMTLCERRRGLAMAYAAAYAASILFWISYPGLIAAGMAAAAHDGQSLGAPYFLQRVWGVLSAIDPLAPAPMMLNLLRFISWQHMLAIPLLLAAWPCIRRGEGIARPLAGGLLLTTGAMLVLLPYQGHGWGYRYLHGLIGSVCLLAGYGWNTLGGTARPRALLGAATAMTLLLILPYKIFKAAAFVTPYRDAVRVIGASTADIVIVDSDFIFFGEDLVRNDPFLRHSPKVMSLWTMTDAQLDLACRTGHVAVFDADAAYRLGIGKIRPSAEIGAESLEKRARMAARKCGAPVDFP